MDQPLLDLTWDYPRRRAAGRAVRGGGAGRDQRPRRPTATPLSAYTRAEGRRLHRRAAAGSTAGCTPTGSTRRRGGSRAASRTGSLRSGAGRGRQTGASCITGPPPTPTASRGASARPWCGGTPESGKWTGHDVPDFVADKRAGLPARGGRDRRRRPWRRRPVHHAGRRQGVAVRAGRAARRAAARALRAAGLPGRQPAVPAAAEPGAAGAVVQAPGEPDAALAAARPGRRCSRTWRPPTG